MMNSFVGRVLSIASRHLELAISIRNCLFVNMSRYKKDTGPRFALRCDKRRNLVTTCDMVGYSTKW
jgi:hypothetical protein